MYPILAPGKSVRIFMRRSSFVVVAPSFLGEASEGEKFPLRQSNRLVSDCSEGAAVVLFGFSPAGGGQQRAEAETG